MAIKRIGGGAMKKREFRYAVVLIVCSIVVPVIVGVATAQILIYLEGPDPGPAETELTEQRLIGTLVWMVFLFEAFFLSGTSMWAKAKGYDGGVGFVIGIVGPVGILTLALLKDKAIEHATARACEDSAKHSERPAVQSAIAYDGIQARCGECDVTADVQIELGEKRAVCPLCGRSELLG
jgi:hypothetical protein